MPKRKLQQPALSTFALRTPSLDGFPQVERELLQGMLEGYTNWRTSRRHGPSSISSSVGVISDFLLYAGGIPGQLTPGDFERWATHLFADRQVAASTQRKYQADVRVFFDYVLGEPRFRNEVRKLLGADIIQVSTPENSIIHRLQDERTRDNGRRSFTAEETDAYFDALDRNIEFAFRAGNGKTLRALQRDKAMFWATLKLGLRAAEVLGLNLDSFESNPSFPELGRYGVVRVFGKGSKWRTVTVLHVEVAEMLAWYVASIRPHYLSKAAPGETALFLSEQGKRLGYSAFYRQHHMHLDSAGLPLTLTPHCLRHTSVSDNDIAGLSLEANRLQHGHEFAATTGGYMHHPDSYVKSEFSRIIKASIQKKSDLDHK